MRKEKILICGASGFIGRNIFDFFATRNDIELIGTCLGDRFSADPRIIDADLTKKENVREVTKGVDTIIHAAAVTAGSKSVASVPERYVADNVVMNALLAEAAFLNRVRHFIFLSCMVLYPSRKEPLKENDVDLFNLHPHYKIGAWIKAFAEQQCVFYAGLGQTKYTSLRLSSVYGPYDKFDHRGHMLDLTVARATDPETKEISILGDGTAVRDFLYVKDLLSLLDLLIRKRNELEQHEVFNVGSGRTASIKELAQLIAKISGRNLAVIHDYSQNNIDTISIPDLSKVKSKLGWNPETNLESGLRQTMDWYTNRRD